MKPVANLTARYAGHMAIAFLVEAHNALEQARRSLTQAEIQLADVPFADSATRKDLLSEIDRMRHQLFADQLAVMEGGDALAWDIRSVVLRVGAAACEVQP